MYRMLRHENTLTSIHEQAFHKFGKVVDLFFILYFTALVIVLTTTYVEIVRVWLFPGLDHWVLIIILIGLVYLFTNSGLRTIVGVCVIAFFLIIPLLLFSHYPSGMLQTGSLFPVFNHSVLEIMQGAKKMTFQLLGIEVLLVAYPFLKDGQASHRFAQWGLAFNIVLYVFIYTITYLIFHEHHLVEIMWPTLSVWQMEYLGISLWLIILLPTMSLYLWSSSYITKQSFSIRQRPALRILTVICIVTASFFQREVDILQLSRVLSTVGFYTLYLYIPFLFIWTTAKRKWGSV